MKKGLKLFLCILLVLLPCLSLWAADFGLVLDQTAGFGGLTGGDTSFDYSASLIPRFSTFFGASSEFFMSASATAKYEDETWSFVPELLRTDVHTRFSGGDFRIGRMYYSDPLGFITEGLFDGARLGFFTSVGIFSAGAWYTGLQYKGRANIAMTPSEAETLALDLDYSDFSNTYFAPKRVIAALGWEHPSLGGRIRGAVTALGQFDLGDDKLHTQYIIGKLTAPVGNVFILDLGGCFEFKEMVDEDMKTAIAGELGFTWLTPIPLNDRLLLLGRYGSGSSSSMSIFQPVTTVTQGAILKPKLSGISMISLDYTARLINSFSFSLSSSYFIRNDELTFVGYPVTEGDGTGYFLGNEFYGWLLWSPVSDLRISLGGGVFLPSMGNVAPKADNLWRVEINAILSLF